MPLCQESFARPETQTVARPGGEVESGAGRHRGRRLAACDWWVGASTEARVHDRLAELKPAPVALLLGTSPRYAGSPIRSIRPASRRLRSFMLPGKWPASSSVVTTGGPITTNR